MSLSPDRYLPDPSHFIIHLLSCILHCVATLRCRQRIKRWVVRRLQQLVSESEKFSNPILHTKFSGCRNITQQERKVHWRRLAFLWSIKIVPSVRIILTPHVSYTVTTHVSFSIILELIVCLRYRGNIHRFNGPIIFIYETGYYTKSALLKVLIVHRVNEYIVKQVGQLWRVKVVGVTSLCYFDRCRQSADLKQSVSMKGTIKLPYYFHHLLICYPNI